MTKRQREEVEFLTEHFCSRAPTEDEIATYIQATVHGKTNIEDKLSSNILRHAKTRLDLQVSLWREDLTRGLITFHELQAEFTDHFGMRLIESIRKSITPEYRRGILCTEDGRLKGEATVAAFANFPEALADLFDESKSGTITQ